MTGAMLRAVVLSAVVLVLAGPLVMMVERLLPPVHTPAPAARRDRTLDLAYLFAQGVALPALAVIVWAVVAPSLGHGVARSFMSRLPSPVEAAAAVVSADLVAYAVHRAEHQVARLWRLHALHHAPETLDWLSGFRFHPLDSLVSQTVPLVVITWIGFSAPVLAVWVVVATVVVLFAHANIDVPDSRISRVVVTPRYHRAHHDRDRVGVNYALVLPCIDMVFGTATFESMPERRFGVADDLPARGYWRQVAWGVQRNSRRPAVSEAPLATTLMAPSTSGSYR